MPRSQENKKRDFIKYSRRHRILYSEHSAEEFDIAVKNLLLELDKSRVPKDLREKLKANLKKFSDKTRKEKAVWEIVNAIEKSEQ
ncbi:MAG: hypothetical protein OEZ34_14560 [Spirochaetia bacterium]|nr:hypothetical protein [Spirochaetia bacterium]